MGRDEQLLSSLSRVMQVPTGLTSNFEKYPLMQGTLPYCLISTNSHKPHLDGMTPTAKEIVQSYRRLYRHGLQAVQYSSPARYVLRDRLQRAYRDGTAEDFNAEKIEKTIEFLSDATKVSGIEHLIVKNLHHVWWWEKKQRYVKPVPTA